MIEDAKVSRRTRTLGAFVALTASFWLGAMSSTSAAEYRVGALKLENPWARATPKGAQVGGGYLTVINTGDASDKLLGGSLINAGHVEIHEMTMDSGIMKMRPVPGGGLEIKPGQTITLQPGGFHIMFMGLTSPLKQGETAKGTLVFEKAGTVAVDFAVGGLAANGSPDDTHSHGK